MATLAHARPSFPAADLGDIIDGPIPSPFPTSTVSSAYALDRVPPPVSQTPMTVDGRSDNDQNQKLLLAALTAVQRSCLIALNTLIAPYSSSWCSITPGSTNSPLAVSTVLCTILSNLSYSTYALPDTTSETILLVELAKRIATMTDSGSLSLEDGHFASALGSLLSYSNRIFLLSLDAPHGVFDIAPEPADAFESLYENLLTLRSNRAMERISTPQESSGTAVDRAVAWSGLDDSVNVLLASCHQHMGGRASMQLYPDSDILPEYDSDPPSYVPSTSFEKDISSPHARPSLSPYPLSVPSTSSEKSRLDLENITSAIDRVYSLIPQIHAQRVELGPAKQEELEFARLWGEVLKMGDRLEHQRAERAEITKSPTPTSLKGKARAEDAEDLDGLMDLINRSQRSRMLEQRVAVPYDLKARRPAVDLGTRFVAEYHENLGTIQVCVEVGEYGGLPPWSADVLPGVTGASSELTLRREGRDIAIINLPVSVPPSPVDVTIQGNLEMKIQGPPTTPTTSNSDPHTPLDAPRLATMSPASFICSSCALPLIHPATDNLQYIDLPSEHWAELVESWMCHPNQKLSGSIAKRGKSGFSPSRSQVLVGGSYLLFHQSSVVESNIRIAGLVESDAWCRIQCVCGANVGGCKSPLGDSIRIYRFAKYSACPLTPSSLVVRLPLSACIVADMLEIVQAHATYRFAIRDEEDEKIRIFIWLFNPSLHLTSGVWSRPTGQKPNVVHAAKVFFKLVDPLGNVDLSSLRTTYPDFTQAEHLVYPLDVCNSLAIALRESNMAYPPSRRTLNGLDMGWLQRN